MIRRRRDPELCDDKNVHWLIDVPTRRYVPAVLSTLLPVVWGGRWPTVRRSLTVM